MDFGAMMKIKGAWDTFTRNHPKFPQFLGAVQRRGIPEGTIMAVTITYPDGQVMDTNIKVTQSDLDLFETIRKIQQ